jgi:hypothetical protein
VSLTHAPAADEADQRIRRAHARAYRYADGFTGFTADLAWATDGASGTGSVVARRGPAVELAGVDAPEARAWVERQLTSIVGHRQPSDYERGDGRHAKRLAATGHVLGDVVELRDELASSYAVRGDDITTVTRTMGEHRFTIVVHERREVAGGAVPTSFTVFYWDRETGALRATEAYADAVVEVGAYFLPASRRIVRGDEQGLSARELTLSGHALLDGDAS